MDSLAIGEINQTVFDCPKCARPLAMGARRCPGCGTRLVLGVPMAKASVIASGGLAVGLLLGGLGGLVFGMTHAPRPTAPGPVAAAPSGAPVVAGSSSAPLLATAPPSPSTPAPSDSSGMPSVTRSALVQAISVDERLAGARQALAAALAASPFDASEVAQILRSISVDSIYGEQLAERIAGWPGSATVGSDLATAYTKIHDLAAEGLVASVRNDTAYRQTAKAMLTLLAGLASVDREVRSLAATNGLTPPGPSVAP